MENVKPNVQSLAKTLTDSFPKLTPEQRRVSLRLYSLLANGAPVATDDVAKSLNIPGNTVKDTLKEWPGVYYDDDGRVRGYWGLAIPKMGHRFEVEGKKLYAWCAWDTLFMPELIGKTAKVESTCPVTRETIKLTVTPDGIESSDKKDINISLLMPDGSNEIENVQASFCHYIYFFSSGGAADKWIAEHPGTFRLSLDEAFELGKIKNKIQYGDALNEK